MKVPFVNKINHWVNKQAQVRLETAYQSARTIKGIEEQHFQGNVIGFYTEKGKTVCDYFQTQLEKELLQIRLNLAQFKVSNFVYHPGDKETEILGKLAFIESVVGRYRDRQKSHKIIEATVISDSTPSPRQQPISPEKHAHRSILGGLRLNESGSFMETVSQIGKEMTPKYEQEVVKNLHQLRRENRIAVRWILLLIIVPISVFFLSRFIVFEPILDQFWDTNPENVEISEEISERYLREFRSVKEGLEVQEILGLVSHEDKEEKILEVANELFKQVGYRSLDAWKNILADAISLGSFILLIYLGRNQLGIVRSFLHRTFQNLNDVTKVYLIILFTDLFVGFHSAEGWEVLLEGVAQHFGLPESKIFVNGFIATVPVILDSTFKLWVFNYLTRSSPPSVAIYEKMNQ